MNTNRKSQKYPLSHIETNVTDSSTVDAEVKSSEEHWAAAMVELESPQRRTGVWAKAFADADGNETKAKALYVKARAWQLLNVANEMLAKRTAELREKATQEKLMALKLQKDIEQLKNQFQRSGLLSNEELSLMIDSAPLEYLTTLTHTISGNTLLHLSAEREIVAHVKALLASGADPCRPNILGLIPAAKTENLDIRRILLGMPDHAYTAEEFRIIEKYGITHNGEQYCIKGQGFELLSDAISRALEIANPPPTKLLVEVLRGNISAAKNILKNGCSPHGTTPLGKSLVDIAQKNNDEGMESLLRSYGAR